MLQDIVPNGEPIIFEIFNQVESEESTDLFKTKCQVEHSTIARDMSVWSWQKFKKMKL